MQVDAVLAASRDMPDSDRPLSSTWVLKETQLAQLTADVWASAQAFSKFPNATVDEIPQVAASLQYPYRNTQS